MKKPFEIMELLAVRLEASDVITTSGGTGAPADGKEDEFDTSGD